MSHAPIALGLDSRAGFVPDDLRIPPRPCFRWIPAAPPEPAWRQAMRWSLIGLTASWTAGEVALLLFGP